MATIVNDRGNILTPSLLFTDRSCIKGNVKALHATNSNWYRRRSVQWSQMNLFLAGDHP